MIEIKHKQTGSVLLRVHASTLAEADLEGADLRGADLRGAHLQQANLRRADLCDALLLDSYFAVRDFQSLSRHSLVGRTTAKVSAGPLGSLPHLVPGLR